MTFLARWLQAWMFPTETGADDRDRNVFRIDQKCVGANIGIYRNGTTLTDDKTTHSNRQCRNNDLVIPVNAKRPKGHMEG